ncbi:cysteine hydrolase [Deinococcus sp. Arct2-2]|uniref:cysteine hydrolase family protein n=1 Tax=Deinococcus sp. Arct2-2 TaxID=2568653 RepID=UPI0010A51E49|nr:cysteine hydrolase family protein [Deinococcus sp. Arct2-2]THF70931.1 cysteine hydrolase [Deinococcus sp. Arct2-2]
MLVVNTHTALILIDIQQGFDDPRWGPRNNVRAEERIALLLEAWRRCGWPLWHVQHFSLQPHSVFAATEEGSRIKPEVRPRAGEPLIRKHVNSAFIGTTLEEELRAAGVTNLVIVGLTTDHCVSTTARMASNLGFQVLMPEDATATFARTGADGGHHSAQSIHESHLASLHGEFVTVTDTVTLLTAMSAEH